jgi:hypothetical protein
MLPNFEIITCIWLLYLSTPSHMCSVQKMYPKIDIFYD